MQKRHKKKRITALMCFTLAIIIIFTQIAPSKIICNTTKAAETTEFKGAIGISGTLKWNITPEGHLTIEGQGSYENNFTVGIYINGPINGPRWLDYRDYIKTAEVNVQDITFTTYMFAGCENLTSVNLNNLNTDKITSTAGMFINCKSLTSIDLSKFNTNKVTSMSNMFNGCSGLTSLDLSNFNTDKVTSMSNMFNGCSGLTSLDVSNFNTDKVISMAGMFNGCSGLTSLDVSNFNTGQVTSMGTMFNGCSGLTSLDLSNFNTGQVISMAGMFNGCSGLISLDVNNFNTGQVISMYDMFAGCKSLTSLDVSNFNTGQVAYMGSMFNGCSGLTSLDLSNFNTNQVTDIPINDTFAQAINKELMYGMNDMFKGCSNLISLDVSNFNTNNITKDFYFSLSDLKSLKELHFFANSSTEYDFPSSDGYYWVNDNQEIVTKTASFTNRKINYSKVEAPVTPTLIPTSAPAPSASASPVVPTSAPSGNDINTGIYTDNACASLAPVSARTLFVYGGNIKQTDGSKVNYKTRTYYTKLQSSNIVTIDKKGKTRTKKGKLVVGVTSTDVQPSLVKGKISKDVTASKIAKAYISKGKVKVTAQKESGVVYVWVMDTGNAGACTCARFVVNAAPSKLQVFARASSDAAFSSDKRNVYKKDVVEIGDSVKLYVYPTYKQNGQFKETKDASYSADVNSQAASYFTVVQDESNPYCFIVTANGLKNNQKTTGKVTIKCNENGRKVVFTVTAVNSIQSVSFDAVSGMTSDAASGSMVTSYVIERSNMDKKTGSFAISTSKSSGDFDTTDKVKIYAMSTANGFDKAMMEKGRIRIISKPSGNQKKLTAKVGSDKKTVTVTAAKKIPAQTSVYYLVFYNNKQGKGYNVVKITTK